MRNKWFSFARLSLPSIRGWIPGAIDNGRRLYLGLLNTFRSRRIQLFPLWPVLRAYRREDLNPDLKAGFNVALVAFPQGIAYALIAGLPPQYGLISAGLGIMVAAVFSGTRLVVSGPTNSTAILLYSGMIAAGLSEEQRILALPLFIMLVGVFQVVGALANMTLVLNYVSRSVVTAFITAAASLIIVNQVHNLLGFPLESGSTFFSILSGTLTSLEQTRLPEVLMGASALVVILLIRRFLPRWPNAALTLIVMGGLALYFEWVGWELRYLAGFSLESFELLVFAFDWGLLGKLAGPAFAVAFVGVLEGSSVGRSLASRSGERLNVNQVMFGMGMANLANSLFGGMDASGSITRSALNFSSGARTALSVFISGAITLALLFTIGFLIGHIPTAALAAVILMVALSLYNKEHIVVSLRATRSDATVFAITLLSALLFALDTAIYIGVFISIVLFLRKAGVPELVEYNFNAEGQLAEAQKAGQRDVPGISILHAEGDLFFGSTELFIEQARQAALDPSLKLVILRLKNARHLDATCALAIKELLQILQQNGCHLLISGASREAYRVFKNSGLLEDLGRDNFFMNVPSNPTMATRNALIRAQELLGRKDSEIHIFVDKRKQQEEQKGAN